jgi:hypothetical protein
MLTFASGVLGVTLIADLRGVEHYAERQAGPPVAQAVE